MAEIVIVNGYAGAGKSTQGTRLAREGFNGITVHHVSAGNRLRDIKTGRSPSRFSADINLPNAPSPLPDEVVNGVVFEAISGDPYDTLVLMDGYPRLPGAVAIFHNMLQAEGHQLIGTIAMEILRETSIERVLTRGGRAGEIIKEGDLEWYAAHRYDEYSLTTTLAIGELGLLAPIERIDAGRDIDAVYLDFKAALGRLTVGHD